MALFSRRLSFSEMTRPPSRDEIIRRGRLVLLDDETPEVLADLTSHGFAVHHWRSAADPGFSRLETGFYDLLLLDYGGIGTAYGSDEGLDVLKHLRRVNPSLLVLAFTGRTFDASKSAFFRECHDVLKKDAGIRETLEKVEFHLGNALTPAHQWLGLCATLGIAPGSKPAAKLEKQLQAVGDGPNRAEALKAVLGRLGPPAGTLLAETLAAKLVELALSAAM